MDSTAASVITKLSIVYLICSISHTFFGELAAATPNKLHPYEVRALGEIARRMGKRDWDLRKDPCSGQGNWSVPFTNNNKGFESNVTCDCTLNNATACHVVRIALKAQNISGGVPPEFSKLRHLTILDLSRNCFNGSIPPQWATMRLVELSFMGNQLSGPFPEVLTKITTLKNLSIEGNRFSGPIPPQIGKLVNLQKLILSSNSFTGELPVTLAKLTNLIDMRISDTGFTGKIPEFIGNWTKIEKLQIQGSPFEGPIPSSISSLTRLSDLRMSDLKGGESSFPLLRNMESMKTLILRKCSISGEIPEYIGDLTKLKHMDISYNNFTWESSSPGECPRGSVNLVESYSASADNKLSKVYPCLKKNFPCSATSNQYYSLHINCGGKEVVVNDTKYEADLEQKGASTFYSRQNWAFSSTGIFMDNDIDSDVYIDTNVSTLHNVTAADSELYTTARASPLSLTYYGLCLMNGNYTVKLHFAEIVYTNDKSFNSLGRRIFDVYIQGKLVLKDFNIEDGAGGAGKPIVKNFTAEVTSHTLKIHFYWAGRGTTGIPVRGVYGPLISAISVDPNFDPPSGKKTHYGVVIGAVAGVIFLVLLVLCILRRKGLLGGKISVDRVGLALGNAFIVLGEGCIGIRRCGAFPLILQSDFHSWMVRSCLTAMVECSEAVDPRYWFGWWSPPPCFWVALVADLVVVVLSACRLSLGAAVAVVVVDGSGVGGCEGWGGGGGWEEVWLRPLQHLPFAIVAPFRYCSTVAAAVAIPDRESVTQLGSLPFESSDSSSGYMAPEYAMRGYLTDKADVYSFGVVALEIVSGKSNTNYRPKEEFVYLLDWAYVLQERGSLLELVDPDLGSEYSSEEAIVMLNVALLCTNASPTLRPTMSQVVSMLEGRTAVQDLLSDPGFSTINSKFKAIRKHFWEDPSVFHSMSTNGPHSDSSLWNIEKEENNILLRLDSVIYDKEVSS
ncbi:hypothetical protein RHGRI_017374 [Rhododendron griersonianum]|uniref:non-specific serine/threonine protein kinase n=1 Tax=Rhododendron griersonianum TaxID=479676 RepID=A0AAV6JXI8_9ERIC|nr:hypothetical protein RHGRI_017374 [Rhododendron griersonianum]